MLSVFPLGIPVLIRYHCRSEIAISPFILPEECEGDVVSRPKTSLSSSSPRQPDLRKSSIRPFTLVEQDKLVIPQKPLYAVFGYAVKALASYSRKDIQDILRPLCESSSLNTKLGKAVELDRPKSRQLDNLTRCILIQNPEHAKALNVRKTMILNAIKEFDSEDQGFQVLQEELHFTRLLLGIASNAKMGSLWHHRKWLYNLIYRTQKGQRKTSSVRENYISNKPLRIDPVQMSLAEMQEELNLVDICAERYPRNYQAWAYRYWLVRCQLCSPCASQEQSSDSYEQSIPSSPDSLAQEYENMEGHLSTHIGDHTAAMHMLNVLRLSTQRDYAWQKVSLLERADAFAVDLVTRYPYTETPWLLLRGVLSFGPLHDSEGGSDEAGARNKHIQDIVSMTKSLRGDEHERELSDSDVHRQHKKDESWESQQAATSQKYARRMLFWLSCLDSSAGFSRLSSDEARRVLEECR